MEDRLVGPNVRNASIVRDVVDGNGGRTAVSGGKKSL